MSDWLRTTYLPSARADDAVGPERFAVWSRRYAGADLGADDFEWATERLADANADQSRLRNEVDRAGPSATVSGEAAHQFIFE